MVPTDNSTVLGLGIEMMGDQSQKVIGIDRKVEKVA